ncbi:hypothetical protein EMIHUDRAFT_203857 [Emiliania huxleyi CCMP1516]|uniref:Uncharacterized protein n=2 Tax=Emiliania huxleyi TaxID=2903 RepID=A0A0D3K0I6_EMIH1|nr:hypothetical protein EMIHUDRAFT_203857 [Emiliania huxleyi CCMP1516]EOD29271.1 hypothetical protein EMIHUDRAFT_203857 [Emiliania huxleyi CCMP1516]|eukprot:XP_005781700.1 hypothetical protein EMIHUDRAFT_203857 [Emiliania huxleyi CCMP1516]
MVMRIGYQIALSPPDGVEARPDWSALSDVWREHVLPHAVTQTTVENGQAASPPRPNRP